jgi:hypothetical protein
LASALGHQEALACQCGGTPTPAEAYDRADSVFSGEVVSITDRLSWWRSAWMRAHDWFADEPYCGFSSSGWVTKCGFQVVIAVDQSFKGAPDPRIEVFTGRGDGDCGFAFQARSRYVVYAYRLPSGELTTGLCQRTRPADDAAEDLSFLESPKDAVR